jgi:hypothetical protein
MEREARGAIASAVAGTPECPENVLPAKELFPVGRPSFQSALERKLGKAFEPSQGASRAPAPALHADLTNT